MKRLAARPSLGELFSFVADKVSLDKRICEVVRVRACTLNQVADFLRLRYSTVSVFVERVAEAGRRRQ